MPARQRVSPHERNGRHASHLQAPISNLIASSCVALTMHLVGMFYHSRGAALGQLMPPVAATEGLTSSHCKCLHRRSATYVGAGHLQSGLASSVVYACIAAARWFIPLVAKALTLCVIGIEMIPLRPLFAWVHPFITEPPTMRGRRNGPTKMKTEPTRG